MVSLVATVLNERDNLTEWLGGIFSQSILPDEIIIIDGGSKDGTWEMLVEKSGQNSLIKVWQQPGNISSGRNFAISKAKGEVVVVTDAGCIYDTHWFKIITDPILTGTCQFVTTGFGPWLKTGDRLLTHLIAAATIPASREFDINWLPSSRSVAFKKDLWGAAGGYPEWIPICEDIIFDLKISKLGVVPQYVRKPLVFWRPRTTLLKYFNQLFSYTRSDGHGKLWFYRQIIRYGVYLVGLIMIVVAVKFNPYPVLAFLIGMFVYMKKFWLRWSEFSRTMAKSKKIIGFFLLPPILIWGDLAKMCGWPVGVYERYVGKVKFIPYD